MDDKPKRGIISWWQDVHPIDRPMRNLMAWLVAILVIVSLVIFASVLSHGNERRNAPCEELGSWKAEDLPARCYEYYGLTLVEVD